MISVLGHRMAEISECGSFDQVGSSQVETYPYAMVSVSGHRMAEIYECDSFDQVG
jgi:hypothetical protein